MRYMVLVTKHHDGFCEFNSALTNYEIASPNARSTPAMLPGSWLIPATARHGIRGLLLSGRWWWGGGTTETANTSAAYLTYYTNQVVDELLSNYRRIESSGLISNMLVLIALHF